MAHYMENSKVTYLKFPPVPEKKESLISIAEKGVQPFEGYSVAFSFCSFSKWKCQEKDYAAAFAFAEGYNLSKHIYNCGSLLFIFFRRVRAECRENYIKPPGIFNFWFVIDGIWQKSKKPGNEKLNAEIIKMFISWLIFLGCIPFLVN